MVGDELKTAVFETNAHVIGLPLGWDHGPTKRIVKWLEQKREFLAGVGEFNKTILQGQVMVNVIHLIKLRFM